MAVISSHLHRRSRRPPRAPAAASCTPWHRPCHPRRTRHRRAAAKASAGRPCPTARPLHRDRSGRGSSGALYWREKERRQLPPWPMPCKLPSQKSNSDFPIQRQRGGFKPECPSSFRRIASVGIFFEIMSYIGFIQM